MLSFFYREHQKWSMWRRMAYWLEWRSLASAAMHAHNKPGEFVLLSQSLLLKWPGCQPCTYHQWLMSYVHNETIVCLGCVVSASNKMGGEQRTITCLWLFCIHILAYLSKNITCLDKLQRTISYIWCLLSA